MQIPPAPITWNFASTTATAKGGERGSERVSASGDGLHVSSVLDPTTLTSTLHMQLPFEAIFRPLPPPSTYHHHTHTTTTTTTTNTSANDKHAHIHGTNSNVLYSDLKENSYTYNNNAVSNNSTGILQWEEYRSGVMDRYI